MGRMYINRLSIEEVGCVKKMEAELTPLHAFIGPNDSGKSTMLRAVEAVLRRAQSTSPIHALERWLPSADAAFRVRLRLGSEPFHAELCSSSVDGGFIVESPDARWTYARHGKHLPGHGVPALAPLSTWLQRGARFVRWDADALRKGSKLIPENDAVRLHDERGRGLAGVYDVIFNRGDDARDRLQAEIQRLFPTAQGLRLRNVSNNEKSLELQLTSGERIPAETMSEGMLYYLAFAAVQYLEPTSIMLVEEPENGLHPARIADVVSTLREISKTTQVLIATHSPLLVNELKPEEATVLIRDPDEGTQAHPLGKTPNFADRSKVYALGELWLSYCNGDDEAPLLDPAASDP